MNSSCAALLAVLALAAVATRLPAGAPTPAAATPDRSANLGPYNDTFLEGGIGVTRPLNAAAAAAGPWSIGGWVRAARVAPGWVTVAAVGDSSAERCAGWRGLYLSSGELRACAGPGAELRSGVILQPGRWHALAATFDGAVSRLYVDGRELASAPASAQSVSPHVDLAPVGLRELGEQRAHFGGQVALFGISTWAHSAAEVAAFAAARPDFGLITFNAVGAGWPWQERAWRGLQQPQDPWTLPHANTPPGAPAPPRAEPAEPAKPGEPAEASEPAVAEARAAQDPGGADGSIIGNWRLQPAPQVTASGAQLSQPGFSDHDWYAAVVPGTVLGTLIARGVYPDPDHGLDNLAIPDSLCRQDYWYRSVFTVPRQWRGRDLTLTFKGINYAAEVWLNGLKVGGIRGAFIRGSFDVTGVVATGAANALAVRISPPPHPGIPHEESIAAGPGENGGALAIDGPTFIASEGWDWIPGIRDRNTGIWQDVQITATGRLHLGDARVTTHLPLPRIDTADVSIEVPVDNRSAAPLAATVSAEFGGVTVEKAASLPPGVTTLRFDPAEFPELRLRAPRLWWPNGYGPANLYTLHLAVRSGGSVSDSAALRFGIRELTYELSLFDHEGRLRRVEVDPALGTLRGERLVDVRHEAIKRTPNGWAASLTAAGENSPAVRAADGRSLSPYLVLRVNGVPIAARGGSWGMDDSRKRISRGRLEPYFELHRNANLNIIRNWLGQNTEEVFYDLADEYGLLVLNDFWVSTQDFQMEPGDPQLFLANARDVVSRYRNHPSIALWFGRNEGVPPPILNEGLAALVAELDGTRYYTGSSNAVNLQVSGPYDYRPPEQYFTGLARGFSVEVGTPSLSTLESLRASIPEPDRWPLSDTMAYHDWHFGGNGDVAGFMAALAGQYGAGTSLEDFERKSQLMNYVSYRAIFEGFQAHLWSENSGRLLWMTHPSWPSNTWQIYSADYDTGAAYYAVKKACEPVHVQMNLPDYGLAVVNTTRNDRRNLALEARVWSLDHRLLAERTLRLDARADATTALGNALDVAGALEREPLVLVRLELKDDTGVVSDNVYWQSRTPADQLGLNDLPAAPLELAARVGAAGPAGTDIHVAVRNRGGAPALNAKLTMLDAGGARVLPVYYSDNYLTLLPGEMREITVRCPAGLPACSRVALRGWNVVPGERAIDPGH